MKQEWIIGEQEIKNCLTKIAGKKIAFVDENVFKKSKNILDDYCFELFYIIPSGEESKSWETVQNMIAFLLKNEIDKNDFIFGIGGGVTTDLTGFTASIYKRGIRFALIPTTILAMVDASIGGKNGINTIYAKNMVGTIAFPEYIAWDFRFLKTLQKKEWKNGFAEIIKHGFLFSESLIDTLIQKDIFYYEDNLIDLQNIILQAAKLKQNIVEIDPFEQDLRKKLNFGHTLGHAFEKYENIDHGHAVIKGMYWELKFQEKNSLITNESSKILVVYQKLHEKYYPIDLDFVGEDALIAYLKLDKKRNKDNITLTTILEPGNSKMENISINKLIDFIYENANRT